MFFKKWKRENLPFLVLSLFCVMNSWWLSHSWDHIIKSKKLLLHCITEKAALEIVPQLYIWREMFQMLLKQGRLWPKMPPENPSVVTE